MTLEPNLSDRRSHRIKGLRSSAGPPARVLRGDHLGGKGLVPPVAVLIESALEHNLATMARYCRENGVSLAPHAKTSMASWLIDRQMRHGAWGVTAATVYQAGVFADFGVPRVLIASQVTDQGGLSELASLVRDRPGTEFHLIVDSREGVRLLERAARSFVGDRPIPVLVELGVPGRRTGLRTVDALVEVARHVADSPGLELRGVEGYEGVLAGVAGPVTAIDRYLDDLGAALTDLVEHRLVNVDRPILSAGGSAYFDRVVALSERLDSSTHVILRSGCYAIHDHGKYRETSPLDGRSTGGPVLRPAVEVWASVISIPEPGLLIVNAGRRDLSYDDRLPVAIKKLRRGSGAVEVITPWWNASTMNDQHTMLETYPSDTVAIGDLVGMGISHPCTTFDKWRTIVVVDDDYDVTDVFNTHF